MSGKNLITFMSPAGTTRKVANIICDSLKKSGHYCELFDLGCEPNRQSFIQTLANMQKGDCLWIGSPVYAGAPLWPIMDLLQDLEPNKGVSFVPFVTYGKVNSGFALYELGKQLTEKGFILMGAAKVLALHSMMWLDKEPFGKDRPNSEDEILIQELVARVLERMATSPTVALPLKELDYQPNNHKQRGTKWQPSKFKNLFPLPRVNEESCTECGVCALNCPMQNLEGKNRQPGKNCIFCFNCLRLCPTAALEHPAKGKMSLKVRAFADIFKESPETKIF